jgi:uncharacterized protein YjbI with pentapeptide repeats
MTNRRKTISRPRFKPKPSPSYSAEISRINELSRTSRTVWLSLLGYLAFVGITLLGVDDADFFVPSRQTQLPLINVSIPTSSFFLFSPILGAALYVYLHLYLVKLWEALAVPSAEIDGQYLSDVVTPWLIVDYGLAQRKDGALRIRTLGWLSRFVTFMLVFVAGPIVIGATWWLYWPAHDAFGAVLIAVCLWVSMDACIKSSLHAQEWLEGGQSSRPKPLRYAGWAISLIFGVGLVFVTLAKTGVIEHDGYLEMARADLTEQELVQRPAGWLDYASARRTYRSEFCAARGLSVTVCGMSPIDQAETPINQDVARTNWAKTFGLSPEQHANYFYDLEASFQSAWHEEYGVQISLLPNLSLRGRDLRNVLGEHAFMNGADMRDAVLQGANLRSAEMQGVNLEDAQLQGADLEEAQLQGADLEDAQLQGANLTEAEFQGADLEDANFLDAILQNAVLQGANLRGAMLQGVNLWNANLEGAYLRGAELQGADLRFANLEDAELSFAKLHGADLTRANLKNTRWPGTIIGAITAHNADFRGAANLTQLKLKRVIGNESTLLYSNEGLTLNVWSCWDKEDVPENLNSLLSRNLAGGNLFALKEKWICSEDNPRRAVGTTLHPDKPRPN